MKTLVFLIAFFGFLTFSLAEDFEECYFIDANFTLFNLCPFAQVKTTFNVTRASDIVSFTLGNDRTRNCDNTTDVWGIYREGNTCIDIAVQSPDYKMISKPIFFLNLTNHFLRRK
jgi:hypothetical protein